MELHWDYGLCFRGATWRLGKEAKRSQVAAPIEPLMETRPQALHYVYKSLYIPRAPKFLKHPQVGVFGAS